MNTHAELLWRSCLLSAATRWGFPWRRSGGKPSAHRGTGCTWWYGGPWRDFQSGDPCWRRHLFKAQQQQQQCTFNKHTRHVKRSFQRGTKKQWRCLSEVDCKPTVIFIRCIYYREYRIRLHGRFDKEQIKGVFMLHMKLRWPCRQGQDRRSC